MYFLVKGIDENDRDLSYNLSNHIYNVRYNGEYLRFWLDDHKIFLLFSIANLTETTFEIESEIFNSKNSLVCGNTWHDRSVEIMIREKN